MSLHRKLIRPDHIAMTPYLNGKTKLWGGMGELPIGSVFSYPRKKIRRLSTSMPLQSVSVLIAQLPPKGRSGVREPVLRFHPQKQVDRE